MTNEAAQEVWQRRADQIEAAIIGESARWGDAREGEVVNVPPRDDDSLDDGRHLAQFDCERSRLPDSAKLFAGPFAICGRRPVSKSGRTVVQPAWRHRAERLQCQHHRAGWRGQVREVVFRESSAGNRARLYGFTLFSEVPPPPVIELTLQVNTATGAVSILNEQSVNFDMSYYEIRSDSATGALNRAGWLSLDDAEDSDPPGTGWDEAPNGGTNILSEVNLQAMTTFEPLDSVSLGTAFSVGGPQNLRFYYAGPEEMMLREGIISYVTTADLPGDFNGDNKVDAADYVVWRKTDGTQPGYDLWRTNFGRTSGSGASLMAGAAVPEHSTMLLGAFGAVLLITAVVREPWRSKNDS